LTIEFVVPDARSDDRKAAASANCWAVGPTPSMDSPAMISG